MNRQKENKVAEFKNKYRVLENKYYIKEQKYTRAQPLLRWLHIMLHKSHSEKIVSVIFVSEN